MDFLATYKLLQKKFNQEESIISIPELKLEIRNYEFESFNKTLLPGSADYHCYEHNIKFESSPLPISNSGSKELDDLLNQKDTDIIENIHFKYSIFLPKPKLKEKEKRRIPKDSILLLHGLNEKDWSKYLPWAAALVKQTGKAVILFPIAFHMNRAPASWSDPKLMNRVGKIRKKLQPYLGNASFVNTAISARLQIMPERFLWSGLQTFFDIVQLIRSIKEGTHPILPRNTKLDIFSYSIGTFLAEILIMTDPYSYLSKSKLFSFCGGPTLNRMSASSKYILDSEANIAVYSYFIEQLDLQLKKHKRLSHYFSNLHPVGTYFRSMLDYHGLKDLRENRLREIAPRVTAICLRQDEVIPPAEVKAVFKGESRKIPVKVKSWDFPFQYDHVTPFPLKKEIRKDVDKQFQRIFRAAGKFYK